MATRVHIPSLAALGAATAGAIGRHLDWTFRAMSRHEQRTEIPLYVRIPA